MVVGIEPGSPAERAGVLAGDIILGLDGVTITGADDLIRLLAGEKIGRKVALDTLRKGERRALAITPGERVPRA